MRIPVPLLLAMSLTLTACEHNTDLVAKLNAEPLGNTNQSNIAAMVANPADLVRGHGGGPIDGAPAVLSIERIQMDHPKPFPSSGGSSGGSGGGSGGGGGGSGG
jgi:type IV pilus biogenesis protein CpaD/CtpE